MSIPAELKYSSDHEWLRVEGKTAVLGITDFAQAQLGDVVFVELPQVGRTLACGEAIAVIESVKAVSDVYAPVAGKVIKVNEPLEESPELVNQSPYGEGWIAVIELADESELANLLDAVAYEKLAAEGGY